MTVACCQNLTKTYGKKVAVDRVDLEIHDQDIVGLLGPNGAGKSTLIKMMTGLVWPTSGSVKIGEHDVHADHPRAMQQVGAIIEWPAFIPYLTARRNLQILSGAGGAGYDARLQQVMDLVNMTPNLDKRVDRFSTGMKQRLGIALALLPQNRFVILDEPTNGLDPNGIEEVRQILHTSNRTLGTTILLSSHMLSEVEQVCNKVAVIHRGKIVAAGPIEELLSGSGELLIRADPLEKAEQLLGSMAADSDTPVQGVSVVDGILHVQTPEASVARINVLLVNQECQVSYLQWQKRSLAEFFNQVTDGETDVA